MKATWLKLAMTPSQTVLCAAYPAVDSYIDAIIAARRELR
jgi:hypothetical protein